MQGYLGETDVTEQHPLTPTEAALLFIEMYGGIDGDRHKAWVLDQVARILNGAPVMVAEARWENGHTELRYSVGTSGQYRRWANRIDDYEEGIAP